MPRTWHEPRHALQVAGQIWRDAGLISEMKAMAEENRRLKRMFADVSMQADLLKEALAKK